MAEVFDTYKSSDSFDVFIQSSVTPGFIIAVACKDECVTNLSYAAKEWFKSLGSKQIWNLKYRQGFALIAISGNKEEIYEKRAQDKNDYVHLSQIIHG